MVIIMGILHSILMMGVLALTYDYYDNIPKDYSHLVDLIEIPVHFGVIGISVLWAIGHAIFGGILGMAGGSLGEGIRLALVLGTANSIGRLWPYVLTFAGGAFLNHAENWVVIVAFLAGLLCLGISLFMTFIKNA